MNHPSALELALPGGAEVEDGEWVLAIFELGAARRTTSAAACGARAPGEARVVFEPRDWQRLSELVESELERQDDVSSATRAVSPAADEARPTEGGVASSRPRVLLVDDDADIRVVVTAMLEAVDLVVTTASSAEEALSWLAEASFDLVVLDWNLPAMNGLDLCRALRARPMLSQTPVLFLTANACARDRSDALACGADDYVIKPFRAPELSARIFSLLRRGASP